MPRSSKDDYLDSRLLDEPSARLEKPIELRNLIENCSDFTIRTMDEEEIEKAEETDVSLVYSLEELQPYTLTELLEPPSDDEDDDPTYDEISKSFPRFRKRMRDVTSDGKVKKLIDHESHDQKVPSEGNIVVYYHYAAYTEYNENPFDCSRLRQKRPESKTLGIGEVLPGLEIALRSMRRGEKAKFLVHPDLAFRERGVPPRIPPNATILFDVELIDICDDTRVEEVSTRERTFDENLALAERLRARGNKAKKHEKNLSGAISSYRKGLQILIEASFDNDEDEKRRRKEMLHMYTNLAVCYVERKSWKLVCKIYNDAVIDCGGEAEKHEKLLFNSGKALRMLGSFDDALIRLRRALRLKPANVSILNEIEATIEARKQYLNNEKQSCQQMFGFMKLEDTEKTNKAEEELLRTVGEEFKKDILQMLDYIEREDRRNETLNAANFTYAEKQFIRKMCAQRNFLYRTPNECTIIIIKKTV